MPDEHPAWARWVDFVVDLHWNKHSANQVRAQCISPSRQWRLRLTATIASDALQVLVEPEERISGRVTVDDGLRRLLGAGDLPRHYSTVTYDLQGDDDVALMIIRAAAEAMDEWCTAEVERAMLENPGGEA